MHNYTDYIEKTNNVCKKQHVINILNTLFRRNNDKKIKLIECYFRCTSIPLA